MTGALGCGADFGARLIDSDLIAVLGDIRTPSAALTPNRAP